MNLLENIIETALRNIGCSAVSIKDHEWGHTRQSIRWGWLYLPGPGLCSICWVGLRRISAKLRAKSYYSVWPENQADKFGGVPKR